MRQATLNLIRNRNGSYSKSVAFALSRVVLAEMGGKPIICTRYYVEVGSKGRVVSYLKLVTDLLDAESFEYEFIGAGKLHVTPEAIQHFKLIRSKLGITSKTK